MTTTIDFDIDGPAAPPRSNGELVFEEPWQSRAFGLVMSLHESGAFTWEEFRAELISAIAAWEEQETPSEEYSYYQCWVTALEQVTVHNELVTQMIWQAERETLHCAQPGTTTITTMITTMITTTSGVPYQISPVLHDRCHSVGSPRPPTCSRLGQIGLRR